MFIMLVLKGIAYMKTWSYLIFDGALSVYDDFFSFVFLPRICIVTACHKMLTLIAVLTSTLIGHQCVVASQAGLSGRLGASWCSFVQVDNVTGHARACVLIDPSPVALWQSFVTPDNNTRTLSASLEKLCVMSYFITSLWMQDVILAPLSIQSTADSWLFVGNDNS